MDVLKEELRTLLPDTEEELWLSKTCFVLYDNHPRDNKDIDITICTRLCEVKEIYRREIINSIIIDSSSRPQNIRILRNRNCDLYYLVATADELFIISRNEELKVVHRITNVSRYEIDDPECSGQARLKIIRKDDAVPLIFDDNFEKLGDTNEILGNIPEENNFPILTQLARKLTEIKYIMECNEKVYRDLLKLRQLASHSNYKSNAPKSCDTVYSDSKDVSKVLKIKPRSEGHFSKTGKPWIKICNKKIVLIFEVMNTSIVPTEDIHILLHGSTQPSIAYTTTVFEKIPTSNFWKENTSNSIRNDQPCAVVLVIAVKELKYTVTSRIKINGVISYKIQSKEEIMPFEIDSFSALETMDPKFNALAMELENFDEYCTLAVLATSKKVDLHWRHIETQSESIRPVVPDPIYMLCRYWSAEKVKGTSNVVLHTKSLHHLLSGVLIQQCERIGITGWLISIYVRSPAQILAFIHYLHNTMSGSIIATLPSQKITAKVPGLAKYSEDITQVTKQTNYTGFGTLVLNQTASLIKYLDDCMIKMGDSKNAVVLSKIGTEIDIFAGGTSQFSVLKSELLEGILKQIQALEFKVNEEEPEGMVINID